MRASIAALGAFPARPGGCRTHPGVKGNGEEAQTPAARGCPPTTPARFLCGFLCRLAHASQPRRFWAGIAPTACKKVCKSMQIYAVLCRGKIAQKVSKTETGRKKWQTRRTAWNRPGRADFERREKNGAVFQAVPDSARRENGGEKLVSRSFYQCHRVPAPSMYRCDRFNKGIPRGDKSLTASNIADHILFVHART